MLIPMVTGRLRGFPRQAFTCCVVGLLVVAGLLSASTVANAQSNSVATNTSLQVLSGGTSISTVAAGTMVELRASITADGAAFGRGMVRFCDANVPFCTGTHLLGTVPVTSQGIASLRFRVGAGAKIYNAVFSGTSTALTSTSTKAFLTVTQTQPTVTSLTSSGSTGNYTLQATVSTAAALGMSVELSGQTASFVDQTNGNAVLGTAQLDQASIVASWNGNSLTAGTGPQGVAIGDFNGDGIADIAIANSALNEGNPTASDHGTVNIYLGNGDGTFTQAPHSPITVGLDTRSVGIIDLNGDGIQDLVVLNSYSQDVYVLMGVGDGTFTQAVGSPFPGGGNTNPYSVTFGDFNRDGKMDMAVAGWGGQAPNNKGAISIFLGNGDGSFQSPLLQPLGVFVLYATSVVAGDFNNDGFTDLAVARTAEDEISILLGNGDGTFQEAASSPIALPAGSKPYNVITTDFNGDGIADLAIKNVGSGTVTVLLGTEGGDGSFTQPDTSNMFGPNFQAIDSIANGDFNGDGIPDIVQAGFNGDSAIYFGVGDGTFTKALNTADPGNAPQSLAVGDFNGDGIDDIVAGDYNGNSATILTTNAVVQALATGSKITPLGSGTHKVFAQFADVGSLVGSISPTVDLTASPGAPSVIITSSSRSILTTDELTVTVKLSGGPANPSPSGNVKLTGGAYTSADAALVNGVATITIPGGSLAGGTDVIAAIYTPDSAGAANYVSTTGNSDSITVTKVTPALSISTASTSISTIDSLVVTVTLTKAPSPTGTVQLTSGAYTSAATTISNGSVSITIPAGSLSAGSDVIKASYAPDTASTPIYNTATATSSLVTVNKVTPSITVSISSTTITDQQPLTINITMGADGQPTPTGSLVVASGPYSAQANLVNGEASISIPAGALTSGADMITLTYSGDPLYNVAVGSASVTVAPIVASATTPSGISAGGNGTAVITVNAGSTYKGTLNLTCTLTNSPTGAQNLPTCNLIPTALTFTSAGSATTTLTVSTTATSALLQNGEGAPWQPAGAVALAALVMVAIPRRRKWSIWLVLLIVAIGGGTLGCGGGGDSTTKPPSTPGTSAGGYVFTVTATDSAAATISTSTEVTFTVK